MRRRTSLVSIFPITFAPAIAVTGHDEATEYPVCVGADGVERIGKIEWAHKEAFPPLAAAIQAISNIRKTKRRREITKPDSRGDKLQKLNDSIANLDADQGAAVVETVEGVQRIRGLAGSGKTIVL